LWVASVWRLRDTHVEFPPSPVSLTPPRGIDARPSVVRPICRLKKREGLGGDARDPAALRSRRRFVPLEEEARFFREQQGVAGQVDVLLVGLGLWKKSV